jgi:hypothetical protein
MDSLKTICGGDISAFPLKAEYAVHSRTIYGNLRFTGMRTSNNHEKGSLAAQVNWALGQ